MSKAPKKPRAKKPKVKSIVGPPSVVLPYGLAIDPGSEHSGWVYFETMKTALGGLQLLKTGNETPNLELVRSFREQFNPQQTRLIIETPRPRGILTSADEMETLVWIGQSRVVSLRRSLDVHVPHGREGASDWSGQHEGSQRQAGAAGSLWRRETSRRRQEVRTVPWQENVRRHDGCVRGVPRLEGRAWGEGRHDEEMCQVSGPRRRARSPCEMPQLLRLGLEIPARAFGRGDKARVAGVRIGSFVGG